ALLAAAFIMTAGNASAQEVNKDPFVKSYSFSLRVGQTKLTSSDFTSNWDFQKAYFQYELALERKFGKVGSIELVMGKAVYKGDKDSIVVLGDSLDYTADMLYISISPKQYIQFNDEFALYVGGGPDYYQTKSAFNYDSPLGNVTEGQNFNTFGVHVLAGAEVIIYKNPWGSGEFDAPVSLFLEYRYTWAEIKEADKDFVDELNATIGAGEEYHDFFIGGHATLAGIKWRF
nr:porin family protein [Phycisphaerae bacterium]NIW40677.1 outer membrane beta-barrel protein [candidate division Zixibacteria bacterium]NIP53169.1 porin family protein [Phycisphaerae bacterium]NIU09729.1 porin family protein [Phycisphaerae bacterium]NIW99510.1 outer membrane beta-barrel protein [Phycisphaerae bacterium]